MNLRLGAMTIAAVTLISAMAVSAQDKTGTAHTEGGQCVIRVYFGTNLDLLNPDAEAALENLTQKYPGAQVNFAGRSDALSPAGANDALTKRRVTNIVNYLKAHGGGAMSFSLASPGTTAPVIPVAGSKAPFVDIRIANCDPAVLANTTTVVPQQGPVGSLTNGAVGAGIGLVGLLALLGSNSTNGTTSTTGTTGK